MVGADQRFRKLYAVGRSAPNRAGLFDWEYEAEGLLDLDAKIDGFGPEILEGEAGAHGCSRIGRDHGAWIQRSLNRLLGTRLVEDGELGPQTRSAIRSFQRRKGLRADGVVGPKTERALVASGAGAPASASTRGKSGCGCAACQRRGQLELEALIDGDLLEQEVAGQEVAGEAVTTAPTPGRYYDIQYGKGGLLTTAARAYGPGAGQARLTRAKEINSHPRNRKYWIKPTNAFERQNFPEGIISFSPIFTCGPSQRRAQPNEKKCFARIYIPPAASPKGPRPAESDGCGVPPRTAQEEFELEVDIEELEPETQNVTVRPRLCFFQNHAISTHRNHFQCGAARQARRIGAIAQPVAGACRRRAGPTPYNTGAEIIAAIEAARACLGRRAVDDIHIFGHSGPSGVYGTTAGSAGLYKDAHGGVDRSAGGRAVVEIPTAALANTVRFVFHGCSTAAGADNVARSLYRHLAASLTNPRVYGHYNGGCAGRNSSWREYSNRHPAGRNLSALPDIVSNRPSGGRQGCCGGT